MNEKVQGTKAQLGTQVGAEAQPESVTVTRPESVTVTKPEKVTTKPETEPKTEPVTRPGEDPRAEGGSRAEAAPDRADQRPDEDQEVTRPGGEPEARALLPQEGEDRAAVLAGPKGSTAATYGTGHKAHVESEGLTPAPGLPAGIS